MIQGSRAWQSEQRFHRASELVEMIFQWRRDRIQPMGTAQVVFKVIARRNGIDAKLDDVQMRVRRQLHFAQHLFGIIRVLREDQDERSALLDRAGDFARVRSARQNIPRSDPAPNPDTLQGRTNGVGYRPVARRVRNENIVRHGFDFLVRPHFPLWIRSLERFPGMKQFQSESVSGPAARE